MVKQTFLNLPKDKRERIIEIAVDEFASKPYSRASLTKIVKSAGIAKGSMYQYFEDKQALFRYLLEFAAQEKLAFLRDVEINSNGGFFETLERILLAGVQFNLVHPQLSRLIANAMESTGEGIIQEFIVSGRKMAHEYYTELLRKGQDRGEVRKDIDARLTGHLLNGILRDGLLDYIQDIMNVDFRELVANPEISRNISEDTIRNIINGAIGFLRIGLSAER